MLKTRTTYRPRKSALASRRGFCRGFCRGNPLKYTDPSGEKWVGYAPELDNYYSDDAQMSRAIAYQEEDLAGWAAHWAAEDAAYARQASIKAYWKSLLSNYNYPLGMGGLGSGSSSSSSGSLWNSISDWFGGSGEDDEDNDDEDSDANTDSGTGDEDLAYAEEEDDSSDAKDFADRPSFSELEKHYQTGSSTEVAEEIGGKVLWNFENVSSYANTCTMRICFAFNRAGYDIPYIKNQTSSGRNGNWYIFRVTQMETYLNTTYGFSDIQGGKRSDFNGVKGIIMFERQWSDATGHFSLWDGNNVLYGDYFDDPNVSKIKLWILK